LWRLACQLPPLATPLEDKPPAPERVEPNVPLLAGPLRENPPPPPALPPPAARPPPPPLPPPPPPRAASTCVSVNTTSMKSANHAMHCIRVMGLMDVILSCSSVVPLRLEPACGRRTRSSPRLPGV